MVNYKRSLLIIGILFLTTSIVNAQENVERMLVGDQKINAVIAIMLIVFFGMIAFLIHLELKIRKVESEF